MPGTHSSAASDFVLNASPTSTAHHNSVRSRPESIAARAAPHAASINRISSGSTPLSRETATNDGNTASANALTSAGDRAEPRRDDPVQQGHRQHRADPLRDEQAERREAEHLRAQRLQPQPQRRLVDGDEPVADRTR